MKFISLACYIALTTAVKVRMTPEETAKMATDIAMVEAANKAANDAKNATNLATMNADMKTANNAKMATDLAMLDAAIKAANEAKMASDMAAMHAATKAASDAAAQTTHDAAKTAEAAVVAANKHAKANGCDDKCKADIAMMNTAKAAAEAAAKNAQTATANYPCDAKCQTEAAMLAAAVTKTQQDAEAARIAKMIAETEKMQDEWEAQQEERMILQHIDYVMKSDTNKDGAVTADEFAEVAGKQFDENKTNALEQHKMREARIAKRWNNEQKWYTPEARDKIVGAFMEMFKKEDTDGDGKIHAFEIRDKIEA